MNIGVAAKMLAVSKRPVFNTAWLLIMFMFSSVCIYQTSDIRHQLYASTSQRTPADSCLNYTLPDAETMSENGRALASPIPSTPIIEVSGGGRGFTVLMLVYSRAAMLRELVKHYACMSAVEGMIILWAQKVPAPPLNGSTQARVRLCLQKVIVKHIDSRGLTTRYHDVHSDIHTDAVVSVDDDQLVDESDVNHAYDVWKKHPWGIVGFTKRGYTVSPKTGLINYNRRPQFYHFVLTSFAFLHRSYIELFDTRLPTEIREEIDRRMNCEDLAMNLLVSDFCRCTAAFYVAPRHPIRRPKAAESNNETRMFKSAIALSSRPKHFTDRSECLNSFSRFYKAQLPPNNCVY